MTENKGFTSAQVYWERELVKATEAYERWRKDNWVGNWGSGFEVISKNVEKIIGDALNALQDAPNRFADSSRFSNYMKAKIEGIYLQIDEKVANITDPFKDTAKDVVDLGKKTAELAKPAAFGAGLGFVLLAAAYLLWKR